MKIFSIFILGVGILIGAIILNFLASKMGFMSWFEFLRDPQSANPLSYLWLFVLYPLGLGITAYFVYKFLGM